MHKHKVLQMTRRLGVHFLKVGDGDSTIIELPDNRIMMVDIMNGSSSYQYDLNYENPIKYLKNLTSSREIYRYIQTHPDMDHMDGLADLLNDFDIVNYWDTNNTKPDPETYDNNFREEDWDAYKNAAKGKELLFSRQSTSIQSTLGPYIYGIYPVSPTPALVSSANDNEDWNSLSYVTLISWDGFKVLLGGDATTEVWDDIVGWINTDNKARQLLSNISVFKASHHGRESGFCGKSLLEFMNPEQIIVDHTVPREWSSYDDYYDFIKRRNGKLFSVGKETIVANAWENYNNYKISYKVAARA